jgi:hypothetical protein
VRWYAKAAAAGDTTAQKNLGQMYENGQGTPKIGPWPRSGIRKARPKDRPTASSLWADATNSESACRRTARLAIQWFQKAGAQGNSQAAYFAKWLKEPTNFIGFRNNTEHNYVMDRLHFAGDFLGGDPAGVTFRSSDERDRFLIAFKSNAVFHEAQAKWAMNRANYQSCMSSGGSNCQAPGAAASSSRAGYGRNFPRSRLRAARAAPSQQDGTKLAGVCESYIYAELDVRGGVCLK